MDGSGQPRSPTPFGPGFTGGFIEQLPCKHSIERGLGPDDHERGPDIGIIPGSQRRDEHADGAGLLPCGLGGRPRDDVDRLIPGYRRPSFSGRAPCTSSCTR